MGTAGAAGCTLFLFPASRMKILVIEDDPTVGQFVKRGFEEQRWRVDLVDNGDEGEARAEAEEYDIVILDMRLPGKSGARVLHDLRARGFERPVLVLTAQDAVDAKVETLRAGADDYVTKPFGRQELLARVEALLRRSGPRSEEPTTYGDGLVTIDFTQREVAVGGNKVALTPLEFKLLTVFVRHPNQVLSHEQLLELVWGDALSGSRARAKLYVGYLRHKLAEAGAEETLIETVRGFGYRYRPRAA
jgi:two-component system, OmpR family, response regulator